MSRAAPAPSAIVRIAAGSQRREPRIMILTRRNLGLAQFQPALCDFSPAASAISDAPAIECDPRILSDRICVGGASN